jgi:hypothetical protein
LAPEVVEAVSEPGHQYQHPLRLVAGELVGHRELVGNHREGGREVFRVEVPGTDEGRPQEQPSADRVVELLVLDDVAAVVEQERGDRADDAGPFGAAEREREGVRHVVLLSTRRC